MTFKEIRFLAGRKQLDAWLDFGSLVPSNPAQFGCAKCLSSSKSEVKFVTGVWVMFKYIPTHPQPCRRVQITGWMSVAHWNGTVYRLGETGDGVTDDLTEDDQELASLARSLALLEIDIEFTPLVLHVLSHCQPRMCEREERIREEKKKRLQKRFANAVSQGAK